MEPKPLTVIQGLLLPNAIHLLVGTSIILLAALALTLALSRHSAAVRHRTWSLSVFAVLLLPAVLLFAPQWRLGLLSSAANSNQLMSSRHLPNAESPTPLFIANPGAGNLPIQNTAGAPLANEPTEYVAELSTAATIGTGTDTASPVPLEPAQGVGASKLASWPALGVLMWCVGALLSALPLLRSVFIVRGICARANPLPGGVCVALATSLGERIGIRRQPPILQSSEINSPVCVGWQRPVVLLPAEWSQWPDDHLRAALAHELAHIRRGDVAWQLLARLACTVYWMHPMIWIAAWRMRIERETACDDQVLEIGESPCRYARLLFQLASEVVRRGAAPSGIAVAMASAAPVERRIRDILRSDLCRRTVGRRAASLLTLATITTLLLAGIANPFASPESKADAADAADPPAASTATDGTASDANGQFDWIRGSDRKLELRLRGEIIDQGGAPARQPRLTVALESTNGSTPLDVDISGSKFELWIPANGVHWRRLVIDASSSDGQRNFLVLPRGQLRQAAIDGVLIKLQNPSRHAEVQVSYAGKAVARAKVKARMASGREMLGETDEAGAWHCSMLPDERLQCLTAWTEEYRIGGFSFDRTPFRDPESGTHHIELVDGRPQTVRTVDESGTAIAGVAFQLQIATPEPDFNYIGTMEHSLMESDKQGEAVFRWFPDWRAVHSYGELRDDQWVQTSNEPEWQDGVLVLTLKRKADRKRVIGRLIADAGNGGGVHVNVSSFQGESRSSGDTSHSFADAKGRFWMDVLPDATYCLYVDDHHWVSETINLIPYRSVPEQVQTSTLTLSPGQQVQVKLTSGPDSQPIANQGVMLQSEYRYSWTENGRDRRGVTGRNVTRTSDERGQVTANFPPGTVKIKTYGTAWRAATTVEVEEGKDSLVELHRELPKSHKVSGQLVLSDGLEDKLVGVKLTIGAIDGQSNELTQITADAPGRFAVSTGATKIGILAYAGDGKAAGAAVSENIAERLEVVMHPTCDYRGRVLDAEGQPLSDLVVYAVVQIEDEGKLPAADPFGATHPRSFEALRLSATTDQDGSYVLRNVPCEVRVSIRVMRAEGTESLGDVYLSPEEERPVAVNRLSGTSPSPPRTGKALAERFASILRDSRLGGFHLMVISAGSSDAAGSLVEERLLDHSRVSAVARFMQLRLSSPAELDAEDAAFAEKMGWPEPSEREVIACAYDAAGKELGRATLSVDDEAVEDKAAAFVQRHSPEKVDASKKWDAAFAEAKRTGRRVWVRVSQRYCGPCFILARWLDDHHELLEKDYVLLKVDNAEDLEGQAVAERLIQGRTVSIPFHGVFDQDGRLLIDSEGPVGNIGSASGYEGKKHLRKMLDETRQRLNVDDIDRLLFSIKD